MSSNKTVFPAIAVVLILVFAIPSLANHNDALVRLVKVAKERDKEVAEQIKDVRKQVAKAQKKGLDASKKNRREESNLYWHEKEVLEYFWGMLERERRMLRQIILTERDGPPHPIMARSNGTHLILSLQQIRSQVDYKENAARVQREVAKHKGEKERIVFIERELETYQESRAALDREEQMLDWYLVAVGAPSVSALLQQQQSALDEERRRKYERERAREFVAGVILALGAATALIVILKSTTTTEADKERARRELSDLNARLRMDCIARGGTFLEAGPGGVGTCTK